MKRIQWMGVGMGLLLAVMAYRPVLAATITVTTTQQSTTDTSLCTLNDAIYAANANQKFMGCAAGDDKGGVEGVTSGDVIVLQAKETYTFTSPFSASFPNALNLVISEILIRGNGATLKREAEESVPFRFFQVQSTGNLTLEDLTLTGGFLATESGAAVDSQGPVRLIRCSVHHNQVKKGPGGGVDGDTIVVYNSAFFNNSATHGGAISARKTLHLVNSTLSANHASDGSALKIHYETETAEIIQSTIVNNTGGPAIGLQAGVTLQDSILSQNMGANQAESNCSKMTIYVAPTFTSMGHNIIGEDGNCDIAAAEGDQFGVAPLLAALTTTTIPGETYHVLQSGSPAIDAGDAGLCTDPLSIWGVTMDLKKDQIGHSRVGTCDIGAIEAVCGDGIAQAILKEACDGNDLVGATCATLPGFEGKTFSGARGCSATCTLETGTCALTPIEPAKPEPAPEPTSESEPKPESEPKSEAEPEPGSAPVSGATTSSEAGGSSQGTGSSQAEVPAGSDQPAAAPAAQTSAAGSSGGCSLIR